MQNPLIWAYKRRSKHKCYLTVLNFCVCATSWKHVDHGVDLSSAKLLISNHQACESTAATTTILLRPFEGRLYELQLSS